MEPILERVREEVSEIDQKAEVILFGSRARGDAHADSDWDILILLSKPLNDKLEELLRNRLYEIELATDEVITSIIEEKSEWEKYAEALIYKNIKRQGIPLA